MYVYLITTKNDRLTYVGATKNVERRLSQHNNEKSGGAKRTTHFSKQGDIWELICYVKGFPTWNAALQFEWKWKYISRSISNEFTSVEKRMIALEELLSSNKSTAKSEPFAEYLLPPTIEWKYEL